MTDLFYIHCNNEILNLAEFSCNFASAKEMAIIIGGELYQFHRDINEFVKVFDSSDENFDPDYWFYENFNPNGGYTVGDLIYPN